jgi:hypothetical protein
MTILAGGSYIIADPAMFLNADLPEITRLAVDTEGAFNLSRRTRFYLWRTPSARFVDSRNRPIIATRGWLACFPFDGVPRANDVFDRPAFRGVDALCYLERQNLMTMGHDPIGVAIETTAPFAVGRDGNVLKAGDLTIDTAPAA